MGVLTDNMGKLFFLIGIVLCVLSLIAVGVAINRCRKLRHEMEVLLQRLDDALLGKRQDLAYDEALDSAISERLDKLVLMFNRIVQQTDNEISSIRALISNLSHQIKIPLTNIMLYTAILQEKLEGEENKELVQKVSGQAEKLDFFMQQLIKSSYAEIEMLHLMPEKSSVNELLGRACQMVELAALKKHIHIGRQHTELSAVFDMKWTVEGISNILDNAIKYSPENTAVGIYVIAYESFVCIQVTDEGIGIREEEQGLVFQRFYRSEAVKDKPGLGIGLYVAREIFAREGGYIKIDSCEGGGTSFKIFLPKI